jgi:hypothetical protein
VPPRPGLRIHILGPHGDIFDEHGHVRDAYALASGDWVLVRPDGYVGAIVSSGEIEALEMYLRNSGLKQRGIEDGAEPAAGSAIMQPRIVSCELPAVAKSSGTI